MKANQYFTRCNFVILMMGWIGASGSVVALPFGAFDARTVAMGGVGVATGSHNAVFNNPALLTTADEVHEWFLLLPSAGTQTGDPEKLKDELDKFQVAADNLDALVTPANQNAVRESLSAMDESRYHTGGNVAFTIAVPSRILSGAAFLNSYEISNVQAAIDANDITAPGSPYNSTLVHRGIRIVENGFSAAKIIEAENRWLNNIAIGLSVKFLFVEGQGYTETIRTSDVKIDTVGRVSDSQFGLDAGVMKEFGVWKLALVGKNLMTGKYDYGASGEVFKIEPQYRAGFAYKSRRSVLEFNLDLNENEAIGFDSATKIAAIGWEWRPSGWFALRAGINKNLVDNQEEYASMGMGFYLGGFHIDMAGFGGEQGMGVSGQLGFQF